MRTPLLEFKDYLTLKGLKKDSIDKYYNYLKMFSVYERLSQESVNAFLMVQNHGNARAFIRNFIDFFKINKDKAVEYGQDLAEIKEIEIPKVTGRKSSKVIKILSEEDVLRIEQLMPRSSLKVMLRVCFDAGLRLRELLSIKESDVNLLKFQSDQTKYGEILIRGKGDKQRIAFVCPEVMVMLWRYMYSNQSSYYNKKNIWCIDRTIWTNTLKEASIKAIGRPVNPHLLRHSRAMDLVKKGADIMYIKEFLGHSNIAATQIYARVNEEQLERKLHQLDSGMAAS